MCGRGGGMRMWWRRSTRIERGLVGAGLLVSLLWLGTRPVLELFGQDPQLARAAALFVAVQAPTAF